MPPIIFMDQDFEGIDLDQDDSLVITVEVTIYTVMKLRGRPLLENIQEDGSAFKGNNPSR